jgi:hypothetical protein
LIEGSTASIIGTIVQNTDSTRQPTYMQTIRFTVAKSGKGWIITKQEQLAST